MITRVGINALFVPFWIQVRGLSHRREGKRGLLCLCQQHLLYFT